MWSLSPGEETVAIWTCSPKNAGFSFFFSLLRKYFTRYSVKERVIPICEPISAMAQSGWLSLSLSLSLPLFPFLSLARSLTHFTLTATSCGWVVIGICISTTPKGLEWSSVWKGHIQISLTQWQCRHTPMENKWGERGRSKESEMNRERERERERERGREWRVFSDLDGVKW